MKVPFGGFSFIPEKALYIELLTLKKIITMTEKQKIWFWVGWVIVSILIGLYIFYESRKEYKKSGSLYMSGQEIFWSIAAIIGGYATIVICIVVAIGCALGWLFEHPWWKRNHLVVKKKTPNPEPYTERKKEEEGVGYATDA